jgi:SnoaL-like domain
MNTLHEELVELLERDKIRRCLARLARGEDRRNAELITESFWPQAVVDYGIFAGPFDEYLAWVVPGAPDVPVTQHVLGQSVIALDTDSALVETHVLAYHRVADGAEHRDTIIGGRYLDSMDKHGNEWRISRRTMIYDWVQGLGASVDWAAGLMGVPIDSSRYTGRATDDHSEQFFGGRGTAWAEDTAE